MYCGECGTKNKKGAKFCENCGADLKEEVTEGQKEEIKKESSNKPKTERREPKKSLTKKQKILIGVIAAVLVVIIVGYNQLKSATSPKKIVEEYFQAYIKNDTSKMSNYYDFSSNGEFTSKKMFEKYISSKNKKSELTGVKNYQISNIEYTNGGLTAKADISYVTASGSNTTTITLNKSSQKKYLLFDNWSVTFSDTDTVKDYTISVPKDSTVTIEGVKIGDSYRDKEESSSSNTYDYYVIPAMFKMDYKAIVKVPMGFELERTLNVRSYKSTSISLSDRDLSEKQKETIVEQAKKDLNLLYTSAISKEEYSKISKNFDTDSEKMENVYKTLSSNVGGSSYRKALEKFEVTELKLSRISTSSDGLLQIYFRIDYKYKVAEGEEKTSYDNAYFYYTGKNNSLKLTNASSLPYYFY